MKIDYSFNSEFNQKNSIIEVYGKWFTKPISFWEVKMEPSITKKFVIEIGILIFEKYFKHNNKSILIRFEDIEGYKEVEGERYFLLYRKKVSDIGYTYLAISLKTGVVVQILPNDKIRFVNSNLEFFYKSFLFIDNLVGLSSLSSELSMSSDYGDKVYSYCEFISSRLRNLATIFLKELDPSCWGEDNKTFWYETIGSWY